MQFADTADRRYLRIYTKPPQRRYDSWSYYSYCLRRHAWLEQFCVSPVSVTECFFCIKFRNFTETVTYMLKVIIMKVLKLLCLTGFALCFSTNVLAQSHHAPVSSFRHGYYAGRPFPVYSYPGPRSFYYGNHGYYGRHSYLPEVLLGSVVVGAMISAPSVVYSNQTYTTYGPYPAYTTTYNTYSSPVYVSEPVTSYTYSDPVPVTSNNSDWLYCSQPDGFYPAIKDCPGGWRKVPAQGR